MVYEQAKQVLGVSLMYNLRILHIATKRRHCHTYAQKQKGIFEQKSATPKVRELPQ